MPRAFSRYGLKRLVGVVIAAAAVAVFVFLSFVGAKDRGSGAVTDVSDEASLPFSPKAQSVEPGQGLSVRRVSGATRRARETKLRKLLEAFRSRGVYFDPDPGDEVVPDAELYRVRPPKISDPEYIQGVMQEQIAPLLTECYDLAVIAGQKQPAGTMRVAFRVVGDPELGAVISASEILENGTAPDLVDTPLAECARETMYAVELPAPPEHGYVDIAFPFVFEPPNDDIAIERLPE